MRLTNEQKHAVASLLKDRDDEQVQTLGGFAGTGKSTLLAHLYTEHLTGFAVCAFTGKASYVLRQKGIPSKTIHSTIYRYMKNEDGNVRFTRRDSIGADGFLVDESSQVSKQLYHDIMSFALPVVFIGDHGQLPPIGLDPGLMENPDHILEKIHRNAGPIAFFAEHLRKGGNPYSFPGGKGVKVVSPREVKDEMLLAVDQVICGFNKTRVEKNRIIRALLGQEGTVQEGDRIICLRNNSQTGLFNGQQGVVTRIWGRDRFDFESDGMLWEKVSYDPSWFGREKGEVNHDLKSPNPFDYAHTITCHKSQGSEYDSVLVYEQQCDFWEPPRWNYTAASRAKESLIWVAA